MKRTARAAKGGQDERKVRLPPTRQLIQIHNEMRHGFMVFWKCYGHFFLVFYISEAKPQRSVAK